MKGKFTHKGRRHRNGRAGPGAIRGGSMAHRAGWPSAGMVIGCLALIVALGGTSYAAIQLPPNSVGAKQIKRNAVRSSEVKNRSLLAVDFAAGQLPAGPRGAPGRPGAPGVEAAPAPIVGSWTVTVNRPGLPTLTSLQTYTKGRAVVETASGGIAARSTSHGAWRRVAAHRYGVTMVFFRYDPASGAYLGTVKLRRVLEFAPDDQSFTGVSVAELRDPAGNLLPGSNARRDAETGVRINVEPIPAQP